MIAEPPSRGLPRGLVGLLLILFVLLLLLLLWLALGMDFFQRSNAGSLTSITPVAGGVVIPTNTAIPVPSLDNAENTLTAADTDVESTATNSTGIESTSVDNSASSASPPIDTSTDQANAITYMPNQPVIITNQATSGSANPMPLLAAPGASTQIRELYPAGTKLTILEPEGDYTQYPVIIDGVSWVRVQDRMGLVGWTKAEMLQPVQPIAIDEPVQLLIDQVKQDGQPADQPADQPAADQPAVNQPAPANTTEPIAEPTAEPPEEPTAVPTTAPTLEPAPTSTPAG